MPDGTIKNGLRNLIPWEKWRYLKGGEYCSADNPDKALWWTSTKSKNRTLWLQMLKKKKIRKPLLPIMRREMMIFVKIKFGFFLNGSSDYSVKKY